MFLRQVANSENEQILENWKKDSAWSATTSITLALSKGELLELVLTTFFELNEFSKIDTGR